MPDRNDLMVTTAGRKVRLRPVSHIELQEIDGVVRREFEERDEPLAVPIYEAQIAGGGVQVFQHDEESLEYPFSLALRETDGDQEAAEKLAAARTVGARAAWDAHKDAVARLGAEINRRKGLFLFEEGVADDDTGQAWDGTVPKEWIAHRQRHKFEVPEDPFQLRLFYILRGLLVTQQDQSEAAARVLALTATGVDNEKVTAAIDFFRLSMARRASADRTEAQAQPGVLEDEPAGGGG